MSIKVGTSPVDTAVTFFDVNGTTKIASFDDQVPRPNNATATNTAFQHHVATSGPICVRLEDYSSWAMDTTVVNRGAVRLLVGVIDAGTNFVNFDTEPNDMASAPQTGKAITAGGQFYGELYGLLNNATDQDVYAFTTGDGGVTLEIDVLPVGDTRFPAMPAISSYGSTLPRYTATVQDMSGAVLASLPPPMSNVNSQSQSLYVPVTPFTRYTVHIQRPAGIAAGANDFYVANVSGGDLDNDPEVEPNENDGTATPLTLTMGQAFLRGTISTAGTDVDTFSLPVAANGVVEVVCSSRRSGSGLRGFNVELHDSAGTSLKNESEVETETLAWLSDDLTANPPQLGDAVRVGDAGTYFLKFTAPTQDTTVTGKYYRCGVTVTP